MNLPALQGLEAGDVVSHPIPGIEAGEVRVDVCPTLGQRGVAACEFREGYLAYSVT
jgi:hypothetical protein